MIIAYCCFWSLVWNGTGKLITFDIWYLGLEGHIGQSFGSIFDFFFLLLRVAKMASSVFRAPFRFLT